MSLKADLAPFESSVQFSSVTQSCLTLCNPVDCSMPGSPVHHQLLELTQTHVQSSDDIISLADRMTVSKFSSLWTTGLRVLVSHWLLRRGLP